MSARLAVVVVLPVLLRLHLHITTAGTTIAVSLPVVIPVVLGVVSAAAVVLFVRHVRGFRSSPYPRSVIARG